MSLSMRDETHPWHLIPRDDLKPHRKSQTCWCSPEQHEESGVWLHNSLDGREDYENGRPLQ